MKQLQIWFPIKPVLFNQLFGENKNPIYAQLGMKGHNGCDFFTVDGQIVRAAHNGIVTYAGEDGSSGLLIVVRTQEKYDYKGTEVYFKSLYAHLKAGSFRVKAGQIVRVGDILALSDNTGASTGTHLHFGLKPVYPGEQDWQWFNYEQDNGYNGAIDPAPYWKGNAEIWVTVFNLQERINKIALLINKMLSS